jgi:hypothetical protein
LVVTARPGTLGREPESAITKQLEQTVSDGRMRLTPSTASMGNDWQCA